ncbi:hypothetical protein LXA01_17935, partial [Erwinia amylovora]|uniref:hypothetical protein n=1 Tax=Erwinia amylovora TaxID=552 RepID=UPI0020BD7EFB
MFLILFVMFLMAGVYRIGLFLFLLLFLVIRGVDSHLSLAVTGFSGSGFTALMTSLVNLLIILNACALL